jgi:alpha-tubulin suppressor-like RCC1 family protein
MQLMNAKVLRARIARSAALALPIVGIALAFAGGSAAQAASAALPYCGATIAPGERHVVALNSDGTVFAWGQASSGEVGNNSIATPVTAPTKVHGPGDVGFLSGVVAVVAGDNYSGALKSDGTVWMWGTNGDGSLGDNLNEGNAKTPVQVHGAGDVGFLTDVVQLNSGETQVLALKSDGTVWAWGSNFSGQIGDNSTTERDFPVQVHGPGNVGFLTDIVQVQGGSDGIHSLALKKDGTVWAWGSNSSGELGDNAALDPEKTPVQVHGPGDVGFLTGVAQIAAGWDDSFALKTDGTVWAWGRNSNGRLGDASTTERDTPVQVHGVGDSGFLTGVSQVNAGPDGRHTLALKPDGTVYAWGEGADGRLGNGGTSDSHFPIQVHGVADSGFLSSINQVATGQDPSLAVGTDGTVYAWGLGNNGEMGNNTTTTSNPDPIAVDKSTGLTAVPGKCLAVTADTPNSGPSAGGTSVTISGSGFLGATAVKFGTVNATSFVVNSDSSITAIAPAGVGTVDITVVTPRGTSAVSAADTFTFAAAPVPILPKAGGGPGGSAAYLPLLLGLSLLGASLAWRALRPGTTSSTSRP